MGSVAAADDSAAMEPSTPCCRRTCATGVVDGEPATSAYEIVVWIEHTYNRRRRQRALAKLTPVAYELAFTTLPCLADDEEAA